MNNCFVNIFFLPNVSLFPSRGNYVGKFRAVLMEFEGEGELKGERQKEK